MKSFFSYRLKKLREQKKISQTELAKFLNVSQITISCWESGRQEPSMKRINELAKYFKVPLDYLFGSDFKTEQELINLGIYEISNTAGIPLLICNFNKERINELNISDEKINSIYNIEPERIF